MESRGRTFQPIHPPLLLVSMPTDASPSFEPSHRRAMAGVRFNARVSAFVLAACAVVLFLAPALRVPTAWATGAAALLVLHGSAARPPWPS